MCAFHPDSGKGEMMASNQQTSAQRMVSTFNADPNNSYRTQQRSGTALTPQSRKQPAGQRTGTALTPGVGTSGPGSTVLGG